MILESQEKGHLYKALSQAQVEFPTIRVNRKAFKNEYADLYAMLKPVYPILTKYNLSVHEVSGYLNGIHVYGVRLAHESDQYITNVFPFVYDAPKASDQMTHKIAGSQTYFYRYYVKGILGLLISDDPEDDDGQGDNVDNKTQHSYHEYITKEQLEHVNHLLNGILNLESRKTYSKKITGYYKIDDLAYLPKNEYLTITNKIIAAKSEFNNLVK